MSRRFDAIGRAVILGFGLGGLGLVAAARVTVAEQSAPAGAPPLGDGQGGTGGAASQTAPKRERVRILVQTMPSVKSAKVFYGGRKLGEIAGRYKPLIIDRPRDSGPLDLVVRAEGFLPVNTRAYTFSDSKLYVKLTPETEKHTLFGYKEELPPDPTLLPDGGIAPSPSADASALPAAAPADGGVPR